MLLALYSTTFFETWGHGGKHYETSKLQNLEFQWFQTFENAEHAQIVTSLLPIWNLDCSL